MMPGSPAEPVSPLDAGRGLRPVAGGRGRRGGGGRRLPAAVRGQPRLGAAPAEAVHDRVVGEDGWADVGPGQPADRAGLREPGQAAGGPDGAGRAAPDHRLHPEDLRHHGDHRRGRAEAGHPPSSSGELCLESTLCL